MARGRRPPAPRARRLAGGRLAGARALASSSSTSSTRLPRPLADSEPEGFEEILAAADPGARDPVDVDPHGSPGPGSDAPSAASSASRSRASRAKGSGRSREGTGNWPVAGWFTANGARPRSAGALPVEPCQPADEPCREHRRDPRGRRPQLHDARPRAARALRHRLRLRSTSRRSGSTTCHRAGSSPRSGSRCATSCSTLPAARDGDAAATRSANGSAPGCGSTPTAGQPRATPCARRGWRGRTRASATPRTASTQRCSWRPRTRPRSAESSSAACADVGLSVVPRRQSAGRGARGRRATSPGSSSGSRSWTSCTRATAHYHWVHAINNTALVAAALYALRRRLLRRRSAASCRAAGTPTRTAPRSARSSVRSSTRGSTSGGRRRSRNRIASSLPGFDAITLDELTRRTLAVASPASA